MIDLETLGLKTGSVLASLGAVQFGGGKIHKEFYAELNIQNQLDAGLVVDGDTLRWWMGQSEEARRVFTWEGHHINEALCRFNRFVDEARSSMPGEPANNKLELWGNGANFDNVLLRAAYEKMHLQRPWHNGEDRCYRTIKNLRRDIPLQRVGTYHNALDDAKSQALHLMEIEAALGLPND